MLSGHLASHHATVIMALGSHSVHHYSFPKLPM